MNNYLQRNSQKTKILKKTLKDLSIIYKAHCVSQGHVENDSNSTTKNIRITIAPFMKERAEPLGQEKKGNVSICYDSIKCVENGRDCSDLCSVALVKYRVRPTWRGEGLFGVYRPPYTEARAGKGGNLETGNEVEIMEECCLSACLATLLIQPRLAQEWYHPQWYNQETSINNQENAHDLPSGQSDEANSSIEIPFSQVFQIDNQDQPLQDLQTYCS